MLCMNVNVFLTDSFLCILFKIMAYYQQWNKGFRIIKRRKHTFLNKNRQSEIVDLIKKIVEIITQKKYFVQSFF